jgi:hypothetical protein
MDLADTVSTSKVLRHTSVHEQKSLSPPRNLKSAFGGTIVVSAAKSAASDTEVKVVISWREVCQHTSENTKLGSHVLRFLFAVPCSGELYKPAR